MPSATVQAHAAGGKANGQAALPTRKFRAAVQTHREQIFTKNYVPGSAGTPDQFDVPAYGFLQKIELTVTVTGGVGSGTAAVYKEDAPFSWIQAIQFLDVNSSPIFFQMTGHDLYLLNKYGGYIFSADPKNGFGYTQGGIGGNSVFTVYLPLQLRSRDGLGSLPNKNNATAYKVLFTVAPTTDVFSTAPLPTMPTTLAFRAVMVAWWEPEATDLKGRPQAQLPPGNNTTQYVSKQQITHNTGAVTQKLSRVGYLVRNIIFVQRNATPARADATWPDPATVIYEGQNLTIYPRDLWKNDMQRDYGYFAAAEAANGGDNGVFVMAFNNDFGLQPGDELANGYLPTTSATRLEVQGSAGSAGTLTVLTNDVSARDQMEIAA